MSTQLPERHQENLSDEINTQLRSFGARLRALRRQRGWTLEELACRGGFSKAFLSRLESGDRQASIAAALTLSGIFGVSLAALFESPAVAEPCVIVRGREAMERTSNGLKYAALSNAGRFYNLQPIRVTVPVSRRGDEHFHHDGEEWIYLLSGALTLSLAGKTYDLEPGDAAHFDSRLPHRLIARGRRDAEVLLVASPVLSPAQADAVRPSGMGQRRAIPALSLVNFPATESPSARRKSRQTMVKISSPVTLPLNKPKT